MAKCAIHGVTALAIARKGDIWFEEYGFSRTAEMRMTSWSMAKSVTSLLLGIAIDRGLVASLDDRAEQYVPSLAGTAHGGIAMRHLVNMSSDTRGEEPGHRFNYIELCPLSLGMVLRAVAGTSLSEFAQRTLWQPLGAEADATWQCDGRHHEFNCIGFAARVKDWLRLGQPVAQQGEMNGTRIVRRQWIAECCTWRADEQQVNYGRPDARDGYKAFFWHARNDGSQPYFHGHHGQRVFVDIPTQTVMVQTAVDESPKMLRETYAIFAAAVGDKG